VKSIFKTPSFGPVGALFVLWALTAPLCLAAYGATINCREILVAYSEPLARLLRADAQSAYLQIVENGRARQIELTSHLEKENRANDLTLPYLKIVHSEALPIQLVLEAGDAPLDFFQATAKGRALRRNVELFERKKRNFLSAMQESIGDNGDRMREMKITRTTLLSLMDHWRKKNSDLADAMAFLIYEIRHRRGIPYGLGEFIDSVEATGIDEIVAENILRGTYGETDRAAAIAEEVGIAQIRIAGTLLQARRIRDQRMGDEAARKEEEEKARISKKLPPRAEQIHRAAIVSAANGSSKGKVQYYSDELIGSVTVSGEIPTRSQGNK